MTSRGPLQLCFSVISMFSMQEKPYLNGQPKFKSWKALRGISYMSEQLLLDQNLFHGKV